MSNTIELGAYGSVSTDEAKALAAKGGSMAMEYSKEKFMQLKKYAEDGNWTWKVAGLIAGIMIILLSLLSVIGHFISLTPFSAVIDVYLFVFGVVACLLEYKEMVFTKKYLDIIRREALFLYRPYGRAAFYFFVGVLVMCTDGILGLVVGAYTMIVGAIIYYSSRQAMAALGSLKDSSFDEQQIAAKFKQFDKNNDGTLDTTELAMLTQSLGSKLSLNELESALFLLDTNSDGKIQYSEFLDWWKGKDDFIV